MPKKRRPTTDDGVKNTTGKLHQNLIQRPMDEIMRLSMIPYAEHVILERALPRVEDGLKPVQRRILFTMNELGITPDKPHKKCARIVGDCLGKYHPHGDSSVYEALVRLAQPYSMRGVLVDGHGNFGSIDGDSAAAMRYTEARMAPLALQMLRDIEKDTVPFSFNFDDTLKEPDLLPSRYPNLLVNGTSGIAVGLATNIPPHNLGEVIDATKAYIKNNDITDAGLMKYIKGPDFPTGGIITNKDDLPAIYASGTGKVKVRGKVEVEQAKGGHKLIVITEIPYTMIGAGIAKFLQDVAALQESRKTTDIIDISNQSSKEGIRIVIELKKDADTDNFINLLYKKTRLEDTFGVNMLAIADGRPETLSLKQAIKYNVDFVYETNRRKYTTLLRKEQEKKEVQEGLIKACNVIDLIIEILRGSRDRAQAKACLVEGKTDGINFKNKESKILAAMLKFTERQADAILELRLYRLIGLEIEALQKQYEETTANIYRYEDLLGSRESMSAAIIEELESIKKQYAVKRRTVVDNVEEAVVEEKPVEEMELIFLMDRFGYCRVIDTAAYERNKEAADAENGKFRGSTDSRRRAYADKSAKRHPGRISGPVGEMAVY